MGTAITSSQIQRGSLPLRKTVVTTGGSTGDGRFQEITKRLADARLRDLDLTMLTKLLRKAERVMANTNLLIQSTTGGAGTPATLPCVRARRRTKRHPKTATSR
jgi:hypothetical protein